MQTIVVTGNLGKDAETRTTQGGDTVCSFSVASKQGFGDKATTNWFRCSVWGKRGQSLGPHLVKGTTVTVSGELEVGEYDGKTQLNIRVNDVALQGGKSTGERSQGGGNDAGWTGGGGDGYSGSKFDDDMDGNVPFIDCSPYADVRSKRVI